MRKWCLVPVAEFGPGGVATPSLVALSPFSRMHRWTPPNRTLQKENFLKPQGLGAKLCPGSPSADTKSRTYADLVTQQPQRSQEVKSDRTRGEVTFDCTRGEVTFDPQGSEKEFLG